MLLFLLLLQYFISILFKSDIPMNITDGDIISSIVITFVIQLINIFLLLNNCSKDSKNNGFTVISFIFFLMIWLLDTIHLIKFQGPKEYILNVIGIYTVLMNIIYFFIGKFKFKSY